MVPNQPLQPGGSPGYQLGTPKCDVACRPTANVAANLLGARILTFRPSRKSLRFSIWDVQ